MARRRGALWKLERALNLSFKALTAIEYAPPRNMAGRFGLHYSRPLIYRRNSPPNFS